MPGDDGEDESRFIVGIHNYCDRWCERCAFTDRCRVFAMEQRQWERHLLRGEDPDDPAVVMQDLAETLDESLRMLHEMAEAEGLDFDDEEEEAPDGDVVPSAGLRLGDEPHPLRERAERWCERVLRLLERVRADLPAIGSDLVSIAGELSGAEQAEGERAVERLREACELLSRYGFLVPVKLVRALGSLASAAEATHPVVAQSSREDALGTARLVHECLGKAAAALWNVAEFSRPWQGDALPLAAEAEALRGCVDLEFPGWQEFRRPGLDDPVV